MTSEISNNTCEHLFPSISSNKNMILKTTKDTKNVCSRPLGSKLLIKIITGNNCSTSYYNRWYCTCWW